MFFLSKNYDMKIWGFSVAVLLGRNPNRNKKADCIAPTSYLVEKLKMFHLLAPLESDGDALTSMGRVDF